LFGTGPVLVVVAICIHRVEMVDTRNAAVQWGGVMNHWRGSVAVHKANVAVKCVRWRACLPFCVYRPVVGRNSRGTIAIASMQYCVNRDEDEL
jgi:hypothetical protein